MAKTVDQFSTVENFRTRYNELAQDFGDISGLRTDLRGNIIDAINSVEDKSFFYQEFLYTATAAQTAFTGADAFSNSLSFRQNRIQVYKNGALLRVGDDYTITGIQSDGTYNQVTLTSGASVNDKIAIHAFTGSFLTVQGGGVGGSSLFTETANNTIFNHNSNGVILNASNVGGDGAAETTLDSGVNIQLVGVTKVDGNFSVDTGHTLTAPTITDGTGTFTSGSGTGWTSITSTNFVGALTGNAATATLATDATNVTTTANNSTNETVYPTFVDGATGSQGIETDTGLTYNPSTGMLTTTGVTATVTGTVSSLANHDIDALANVHNATPNDGQILQWVNSNSRWEPMDKDNSDNVAEGSSNLYFTNERVDDRVNALLQEGTGITLTYDDAGNTLTITGVAQYGDEDVLDFLSGTDNASHGLKGGNGIDLVYDDAGNTLTIHSDIESGNGLVATSEATGENTIAVGQGKGIKTNANDVALDYTVTSSAPTGVGSTADGHLWFVV